MLHTNNTDGVALIKFLPAEMVSRAQVRVEVMSSLEVGLAQVAPKRSFPCVSTFVHNDTELVAEHP